MHLTSVVSAKGLGLTFKTSDGDVHGAVGCQSRHRQGRVRLVHRPVRLRQDHVPAGHRRSRTADLGHHHRQRHDRRPMRGVNRAYGYVFQAPALLPVAHHRQERRAAARDHGLWRQRRARVEAHAGPGQPHRLREEVSLAAVGRHAAARLDRPRAGLRCRPAADGRAVRRARRDRPRPPQFGAAEALGARRKRPSPSSPTRSPRRCISRPRSW